MGKFKAVTKVIKPVTDILNPVSDFLGPVGTILSAIGGLQSPKSPSPTPAPGPAQEAPFAPKKPTAMERPGSLGGFAGFDPTQERSALATRGVNTGLMGDEKSYYNNLVARSLLGDDNSITGTPESLLPIESQYFSRQGFDTSNITNLLKALLGG